VASGMLFDVPLCRREIPPYDGHHVQIYVRRILRPVREVAQDGRICEESDQHSNRFKDRADPEPRAPFHHRAECGSMRHPLFMRPLVNRNPSPSNINYAQGYEAWMPALRAQE